MTVTDGGVSGGVVSVACPGGLARQFRVQVRDAAMASQWRLVGSFREAIAARTCAQDQAKKGAVARVVDCRSLPTAA